MPSFLLRVALLAFLSVAAALPAVDSLDTRDDAGLLDRRASSVAAAGVNLQPFNLTDMSLYCSRSNSSQALYNCTVQFQWLDVNSVADNNVSSCVCRSNWTWDGVTAVAGEKNTYNTNYAPCDKEGSTYFEMRFVDFESPANFTLEIAHHYEDYQDFAAPWDYPTTFAQPEFNLEQLELCTNSMAYYDAGPVYANITGISD